ncbi:MAG: hypothetical protein IJB96_04590 [Lachnospira sp.]|nr:hypothetical protein [Lachnospira sp.]
MKTKHLLTGLVLPALFAACTAEEIETSNGMIQNDLNQRPTVGDVTLGFGGVNSRAALDEDGLYNTIEFTENEDGIGARIIDSYSAAGVKDKNDKRVAWKDYEITDYASTNYRYVYNGDVWATNALMVEGNYMFYFPYNEKNLSRGPLEIITPIHQTVKPNEDGGEKNAIAELYAGENPVFVGYKFISAEDQELEQNVDMKPVFAYPYITLTNNWEIEEDGDEFGQDVTITKVVFSSTEGLLKDMYVVNHDYLRNNLTEKVTYTAASSVVTLINAGNWTDDAKLLKNATTTSIATAPATAKDVEITVEFEDGLELAYGEEYSFYVVLPAAVYGAGALDMTIYTEDGKMIGKVTEGADKDIEEIVTFDNGKTMRFAPGKRYATQEYNFPTGKKPETKKNPGKYGVYEITGDDLALIDEIAPAPVISTLSEFEAFLKSIDENVETLKEIETQRTTGEGEFILAQVEDEDGNPLYAELTLNKEFLQLLEEYNYDGEIEFLSKMRAEGTATSANQLVLDDIKFNGGLIATEGYTTVKNITLGQDLTVEGGVLTINHTAPYAKTIEVKAGEAIVANAAFMPEAWNVAIDNIIVAGETLDDEDEVIATGKVTLNYTGTSHLGSSRAKVAGGELVIGSNVTAIVGGSTNWAKGTVTNNGKINIQNAGSDLTILDGVKLVNAGKVEGNGSLINKGEIETSKNLTVANNEGAIKVTDKKVLLTVNAGTAKGIIDNTEAGMVVNNGSNEVVAYLESLVNDGAEEFSYDEASGITKYVLSGEWEVNENTDMETVVEFAEGSSLYVGNDATLTMKANAIIASNVTWTGRKTAATTGTTVNFEEVDGVQTKIIYNKYDSDDADETPDTYYTLTVNYLNVNYNGDPSTHEYDKLINAVANETVNLTGVVDLTSALTIDKNITIKGGTIIGKPITVAPAAKVVFDGVTFNNGTAGNESSIYLKNSTQNITVKNCTFEGSAWDALQIVDIKNNIEVTIEGNTFKTLPTANIHGSYIHIANETVLTNSSIVIKNNTFEEQNVATGDYMVKIYGVIAFDQITAGGNTFADGYKPSANQIYIAKVTNYESAAAADEKEDDQTVYNKFTASTPSTL